MHFPYISAWNSGCPIGQPLFNLLLQKKVDLVLGGHHHNYQRSKQLALVPGTCPSFVIGGFDPDCVADSGAGAMEKGAGSVCRWSERSGALAPRSSSTILSCRTSRERRERATAS